MQVWPCGLQLLRESRQSLQCKLQLLQWLVAFLSICLEPQLREVSMCTRAGWVASSYRTRIEWQEYRQNVIYSISICQDRQIHSWYNMLGTACSLDLRTVANGCPIHHPQPKPAAGLLHSTPYLSHAQFWPPCSDQIAQMPCDPNLDQTRVRKPTFPCHKSLVLALLLHACALTLP